MTHDVLPPVPLPPFDTTTPISEFIDTIRGRDQRQSRLVWENYTDIEHLHALTLDRPPELDTRVFDHFANTSALLGAVNHIDKTHADALLNESLALIRRIPLIGRCLYDGTINQQQFQQLVSATDLVDGWPSAPHVDKQIAQELCDNGAGSTRRLRDLANRAIFAHDPDAMRRRAEQALVRRTATLRPRPDGMAHFGITAAAEDGQLAMAAVEALIAAAICPHDPRKKNARRSDAAMQTLQGLAVMCQCEREDCAATPSEGGMSDRHARIVVHVICQDETLNEDSSGSDGDGDPDEDNPDEGPGDDGSGDGGPSPDSDSDSDSPVDDRPGDSGPRESERSGFLDGYGVITADHVRAIAARPDAIVRPLNPKPGQTLPTHQPGDPYRFSAALDTFIRARDGYCVFPGCNKPAWASDLDHVDEFNHRHPAAGGQTCARDANTKCRYHHLIKTFGEWLDDQFVDAEGFTRVTVTSPDGITVLGRGHNNEALFPALRTVRFQKPPPRGPTTTPDDLDSGGPGPQRSRTRTADKHARRRRARELNRRLRELHDLGPPADDRR
ncbi:DUF222 domain-containing protein [Tomitella biformata]|uniref:DUF222 domain-containing protein n=2 Tax=Tomitella biformata TaxID=630403 RepID=UPI0019066EFC|nr:DUF222 domain-containing protein [Tomitella biformata]